MTIITLIALGFRRDAGKVQSVLEFTFVRFGEHLEEEPFGRRTSSSFDWNFWPERSCLVSKITVSNLNSIKLDSLNPSKQFEQDNRTPVKMVRLEVRFEVEFNLNISDWNSKIQLGNCRLNRKINILNLIRRGDFGKSWTLAESTQNIILRMTKISTKLKKKKENFVWTIFPRSLLRIVSVL